MDEVFLQRLQGAHLSQLLGIVFSRLLHRQLGVDGDHLAVEDRELGEQVGLQRTEAQCHQQKQSVGAWGLPLGLPGSSRLGHDCPIPTSCVSEDPSSIPPEVFQVPGDWRSPGCGLHLSGHTRILFVNTQGPLGFRIKPSPSQHSRRSC